MVFWIIVAAVVVLVLLAAWRADRRRKVTISRRNAEVENDIAGAWMSASIHHINNGGGSGGI
jgi:hypothetical protein